jgi:two-component system CheB/CheR fusion protein
MWVVPYAVGPKVFSGTVLSFVDISEIKLAEVALRDSLQIFAGIVNASPALMWTSDPDMKLGSGSTILG